MCFDPFFPAHFVSDCFQMTENKNLSPAFRKIDLSGPVTPEKLFPVHCHRTRPKGRRKCYFGYHGYMSGREKYFYFATIFLENIFEKERKYIFFLRLQIKNYFLSEHIILKEMLHYIYSIEMLYYIYSIEMLYYLYLIEMLYYLYSIEMLYYLYLYYF